MWPVWTVHSPELIHRDRRSITNRSKQVFEQQKQWWYVLLSVSIVQLDQNCFDRHSVALEWRRSHIKHNVTVQTTARCTTSDTFLVQDLIWKLPRLHLKISDFMWVVLLTRSQRESDLSHMWAKRSDLSHISLVWEHDQRHNKVIITHELWALISVCLSQVLFDSVILP